MTNVSISFFRYTAARSIWQRPPTSASRQTAVIVRIRKTVGKGALHHPQERARGRVAVESAGTLDTGAGELRDGVWSGVFHSA